MEVAWDSDFSEKDLPVLLFLLIIIPMSSKTG